MQALNDDALRGGPLLTSSIQGMSAGYGSLGHSHLNQVFKRTLGKLVSGVAAVVGREGRAPVEVWRHVDEKFAEACEEGIMWEMLSHELVTNEGRGCEHIQAAANSKNADALTHHEI